MSLWGLLTGLGHGLVTGGLGAGEGGDAPPVVEDRPGTIRFTGRAVPLCQLRLSPAAPLCRIRIVTMTNRLHIGDTAKVAIECENSDGDPADPTTLTVVVRPPSGDDISLEYGVAPEVEGGDAVIRTGLGRYVAHIDLTEDRGAGTYTPAAVGTGAVKAAERGGPFKVEALLP